MRARNWAGVGAVVVAACAGDLGNGPEAGDEAVAVAVGSGTSGSVTGTGGGGKVPAEAADLVSFDLPKAMECGATFDAKVVMRNTGAETWKHDEYKLGGVDDDDPLHPIARIDLAEGDMVAPGESHTFGFTMTAPIAEGSYHTDWRMVHELVKWFGPVAESTVTVTCSIKKRSGPVKLQGSSLSDDQGTFNALGASLFWAAWAYKFDKPKLEQNLDYLAKHGFDYIRALGVVGDYQNPDFWDGREIDWHWPDYADVIAGVTDLAYKKYGLRVEWTLIGDGQLTIPQTADRYKLVDTFLAMSKGREQEIIHFEIANEHYKNGFSGAAGIKELRALSAYMKGKTDVLVAASAPQNTDSCDALTEVYSGDIADIATIHFDRDVGKTDGHWRPVRQPWGYAQCGGGIPLVASNNEPIGPGSSVNNEDDPVKMVAGAVNTFASNIPLYVYHSKAGVRGDQNISEMPGAGAFLPMKQTAYVPSDLASWSRKNANWGDSPLQIFAGENGQLVPNAAWMDVSNPQSGCVRAYGQVKGTEFFVVPIGILNKLVMAPRKNMKFDVIDPMSGKLLKSYDLAAGQQFELSGAGAFVLHGNYK